MTLRALATLLLMAASPCHADTRFSGNLQVTGQMAVGTYLPRARLEVQMDPTDAYALLVSSQNAQPLCLMDQAGNLGLSGLSPATARVDIGGAGDNGSIGLQLRVGNSSTTLSSSQLTFGAYGVDQQRHSLVTRHVSSQNLGNSIDFFIWSTTSSFTAIGSTEALALQAIPQASSASVHIDPAGAPDVELEVSNLIATGGGRIHRLLSLTPSSRSIKTDISYLGTAEENRALEDVRSLQHATFRYKAVSGRLADGQQRLVSNPRAPLVRGLIYEDVPASVRGPGNTVVLDDRVANLEMALKVVDARIHEVEEKIAALEAARKTKKK